MRTTFTPASSRAVICAGSAHAGPSVATILVRRTELRIGRSLTSARQRCITTRPPTTVSAARPARKASPSPRSTAGSTSHATRSASIPRRGDRAPVGAGRAGGLQGVRAHHLLETRAAPRAASRRVARRRPLAAPSPRTRPRGVHGGHRHVAPEDDRRAALEERAEGVGAAAALAPMLVHQRDVGEEMGGLHGGDDARARRAGEVARVDALEVLDAVRHRRARQPLQQVQRLAHGRIADGVRRDWRSRAWRPAPWPRAAASSPATGMPRSRLPS